MAEPWKGPLVPGDITGVVLAGGRGSRMNGADKGLQVFNGVPLAQHALQRLAPQVGPLLLNANRNLAAYAAFGAPVVSDETPAAHAGPLAGFLAALTHCNTPWLATVPCDSPLFPNDLVRRLAQAVEQAAALGAAPDLAMAAAPESGSLRPQPVFCLVRVSVRDDLARFLAAGGHKVGAWAAQQKMLRVAFEDAGAFANANTAEDLHSLQGVVGVGSGPP